MPELILRRWLLIRVVLKRKLPSELSIPQQSVTLPLRIPQPQSQIEPLWKTAKTPLSIPLIEASKTSRNRRRILTQEPKETKTTSTSRSILLRIRNPESLQQQKQVITISRQWQNPRTRLKRRQDLPDQSRQTRRTMVITELPQHIKKKMTTMTMEFSARPLR